MEQIGSRPGYSTLAPCFAAGAGYSGCGLAVDVFGSQHALDSSPMDSGAGPLGMETSFAAPGPCASQESSDPAGVSLFLRGVGGSCAVYPAVTEQSNAIVRALWRSAASGTNRCDMCVQDGLVRRQSGEGRRAASLGGRGNGQATAAASTEWSRTATT